MTYDVLKEWQRKKYEYAAAVNQWRSQEDQERTIPSEVELVSFLLRKLRRSKLALRAAVTHAKRTNQRWHKVPEKVIRLWEKEL
jgi:hypothetical protein